jgi:uncharacterized membrane protein (UPF0136 family)
MTRAARRLKWVFLICAIGLAPWAASLYTSQIPRGLAHMVRLMAAGLILAVILGLLLTAWLYRRRSAGSAMAGAFTATAVFVAAWFRTYTHTGGVNWAGTAPTLLLVVVIVVVLCVIVIQAELLGSPYFRWIPPALAVVALGLVPYLVIALTLVPAAQIAYHLQLAWTGLDAFEVLALAATALALFRKPANAVIPATVTGTLLLCDAWLNIVPSTGLGFYEAIAMALVELPLAALSFWVAWRASTGSWPR